MVQLGSLWCTVVQVVHGAIIDYKNLYNNT